MRMIDEALKSYDFINPEAILIRHNENMTYAVTDENGKYLLRIHKADVGLNFNFQCGKTPRYEYIKSEVDLLLNLNDSIDMKIQQPIKNISGSYITKLSSGDYATVLLWIDGEDMTKVNITNDIAFSIGKMIAKIHNYTVKLSPIKRYSYDEFMVERVLCEIENAYKMNHINKYHYQSIRTFLLGFTEYILNEKDKFILVHGDLSKSNLIYHNDNIIPIDFSLSGYSIPEMDLADMICSLNNKNLTPYLIEGYRSESEYIPNEFFIDMHSAYSIILYIAIHHNRFIDDKKPQKSLDRWTNTFIKPICRRM